MLRRDLRQCGDAIKLVQTSQVSDGGSIDRPIIPSNSLNECPVSVELRLAQQTTPSVCLKFC